ncbi:peroxidasin homolog [Oscarella lobularis]|uniref:peroxidasin homolog n=1 Tax=Oscarella lobularis TaxID=121494 RepID=UPI0033138309
MQNLKARQGTKFGRLLHIAAIIASVAFGLNFCSVGDCTSLEAYISFTRPQKYLVYGESTSDDFLVCGGGYSDDTLSGLQISLKLIPFRLGSSIVSFPANNPRYIFNCTPSVPSGDAYVFASSAFCTLGIKPVRLEDTGKYVCETKSSNRSIPAKSAEVVLILFDGFILNAAVPNPQELDVNEFDSVNLSCPVNSQGDLSALNILWRKSGAVLRMANANQIQNAFNYMLPSAKRNDAGIYECIVVSIIYGNMTVDSLKKILHVNFGPLVKIVSGSSLVVNHSTVAVDLHDDNYINCSAEGYPPPDVVLSRNGKEIKDASLKIVSATEKDAGTYCCNASNALGRYNETCFQLFVNFGPVATIATWPFSVLNHSVTVDELDAISINCTAKGYPPPEVVLSHNDKEINDTHGILKISSATEADKGRYCCNASNALGRDSETCFTLLVNFGPIVRISSEPFPIHDHALTVDQNDDFYINCSAEGYPSPVVVVSHNGNQATKASSVEISFMTKRDEGLYCCNASNTLGRHSAECLNVRLQTSSPSNTSGDLPALVFVYVALGIGILILVIIAVTVILLIRRHRRRFPGVERNAETTAALKSRESGHGTITVSKSEVESNLAADEDQSAHIACDGSDAQPLNDVTTRQHLEIVAEVGAEIWSAIGRHLFCCTSDDIEKMLLNCDYATNSEKLLIVLEEWHKQEGENATLERLLEACDKTGIRGDVESELTESMRKRSN